MRSIEDIIKEKGILETAVENVQGLSHEDYALVRKNYFGASDSSILCGVNLYKTLDQLIKEKNNKFLTDEEIEVSKKPIVMKGYELEPIILKNAEDALIELGYDGLLFKPVDMFKFKEVNGLSVNYDGVFLTEDELFPVEAKLVSKYGEKYYNKLVTKEDALAVSMAIEGDSLEHHIKRKANKFGIPAYYYTQVQQEIAGLDSNYGYLAAKFDDSWSFKLFYVKRDDYVIHKMFQAAEENIDKIKREA